MRALQAKKAAEAEAARLEKEKRVKAIRDAQREAHCQRRLERAAAKEKKEQDAINDFNRKARASHPDEFSKEHFLQKQPLYLQEGGGRLYLNRRDPTDSSKGMNPTGYDELWYIKVEEEMLRSQIDNNKAENFTQNAKRLGRLFVIGADHPQIAEHAVLIEKRGVIIYSYALKKKLLRIVLYLIICTSLRSLIYSCVGADRKGRGRS